MITNRVHFRTGWGGNSGSGTPGSQRTNSEIRNVVGSYISGGRNVNVVKNADNTTIVINADDDEDISILRNGSNESSTAMAHGTVATDAGGAYTLSGEKYNQYDIAGANDIPSAISSGALAAVNNVGGYNQSVAVDHFFVSGIWDDTTASIADTAADASAEYTWVYWYWNTTDSKWKLTPTITSGKYLAGYHLTGAFYHLNLEGPLLSVDDITKFIDMNRAFGTKTDALNQLTDYMLFFTSGGPKKMTVKDIETLLTPIHLKEVTLEGYTYEANAVVPDADGEIKISNTGTQLFIRENSGDTNQLNTIFNQEFRIRVEKEDDSAVYREAVVIRSQSISNYVLVTLSNLVNHGQGTFAQGDDLTFISKGRALHYIDVAGSLSSTERLKVPTSYAVAQYLDSKQATDAQISAGSDVKAWVNPKQLKDQIDSVSGATKATNAQIDAYSSVDAYVDPAGLKRGIEKRLDGTLSEEGHTRRSVTSTPDADREIQYVSSLNSWYIYENDTAYNGRHSKFGTGTTNSVDYSIIKNGVVLEKGAGYFIRTSSTLTRFRITSSNISSTDQRTTATINLRLQFRGEHVGNIVDIMKGEGLDLDEINVPSTSSSGQHVVVASNGTELTTADAPSGGGSSWDDLTDFTGPPSATSDGLGVYDNATAERMNFGKLRRALNTLDPLTSKTFSGYTFTTSVTNSAGRVYVKRNGESPNYTYQLQVYPKAADLDEMRDLITGSEYIVVYKTNSNNIDVIGSPANITFSSGVITMSVTHEEHFGNISNDTTNCNIFITGKNLTYANIETDLNASGSKFELASTAYVKANAGGIKSEGWVYATNSSSSTLTQTGLNITSGSLYIHLPYGALVPWSGGTNRLARISIQVGGNWTSLFSSWSTSFAVELRGTSLIQKTGGTGARAGNWITESTYINLLNNTAFISPSYIQSSAAITGIRLSGHGSNGSSPHNLGSGAFFYYKVF